MIEVQQLLSLMTQGTMGTAMAIAVIVIFAIAITRQWEKASLLLFPMTIGVVGIGIGATNWTITTIMIPLTALIFISQIFYENRLLGSKLASKGLSWSEKQLKRIRSVKPPVDLEKIQMDKIKKMSPTQRQAKLMELRQLNEIRDRMFK